MNTKADNMKRIAENMKKKGGIQPFKVEPFPKDFKMPHEIRVERGKELIKEIISQSST